MNCKKIIFVIGFLAVFGFLFSFNTPDAKAATVAELQSLIVKLQQQIAQIQQQLAQLQKKPITWCYDFNVNLKIGDSGAAVSALQTALEKEGFYQRAITGSFDEYTASAVVGFQEKYASEVLAPWGLTHGTGYVGSTTRAKLNKLYSCGVVRPYIRVLSPNGGEQWVIGERYEIDWDSSGVEYVNIVLIDYSAQSQPLEHLIAYQVPNKITAYGWKVSSETTPPIETLLGSRYKIVVADAEGTTKTNPLAGIGPTDTSDNYFSIISSTTTCTDSDGGKNYYVKGTGFGWNTDTEWVGFYDTCYKDYWANLVSSCSGNGCYLAEKYCDGKYVKTELGINCPYGCQDGACISSTTTPSITVISPNGGERWVNREGDRETHTINWKHNLVGNFEAWIDLLKGGTYFGSITGDDIRLQNAQKLTSYSWQVGNIKGGLVEGNDYQVRINYRDLNTGVILKDASDNYFSIVMEGIPPAPILSPAGGEVWQQGTSQVIRWTPYEKTVSSVMISLYQKGVFQKTLSGTISDSSGRWTWNIPSYQSVGSSYSIRVSRLSYPSDFIADSNSFSIVAAATACTDSDGGKNYYVKGTVTYGSRANTDTCSASGYLFEQYCLNNNPVQGTYWCPNGCQDGTCLSTSQPSITLLSPNGGEKWEFGKTQEITWKASSEVDHVDIYLTSQSQGVDCILSRTGSKTDPSEPIPGDKGSYTVILEDLDQIRYCSESSNGITAGDYYKIRMTGYIYGGEEVPSKIFDESDNYFTIMATTLTCTDSDGGKDYYVKGYSKGKPNPNNDWTSGALYADTYDLCVAGKAYEHYCDAAGYLNREIFFCPFGCGDGACLKGEETPVGLEYIESQLASLAEAISRLTKQIKDLMGM